MTSLLDRTATDDRSVPRRGEYRLPVATRGRRPLVTVASALLVVASVAVFASIYSSTDRRAPVLVVTTTILQGQRITGSDLGTVYVAASGGLSVIPVASASELSGTWATVTIPSGSLISLRDVTSSRPLAGGNAVVGLSLKDGQLPADGVQPGNRVMIVQTPGAGSVLPSPATSAGSSSGTTSASGVLVAQATVFEATVPSPSSGSGAAELVSVEVPATLAAAVASASSASEVSLVLLPDPGSTTAGATSGGNVSGGSGSS